MEDVARLVAIEEIKQLKARYFRAVDTKDEALLRQVFTEDSVTDFRGAATDPRTGINGVPNNTGRVIHGLEANVNWIMETLAPLVSIHHGHIPEIDIESEAEASGIFPMVDRLSMPEDSPIVSMDGWGHYHDTFRKERGAWKIATLRLTRLRVDVVTRSASEISQT